MLCGRLPTKTKKSDHDEKGGCPDYPDPDHVIPTNIGQRLKTFLGGFGGLVHCCTHRSTAALHKAKKPLLVPLP